MPTATPWTAAAVRVLNERYALKDAAGTPIETPNDIMRRVANAVAEAERNYGKRPDLWAERFYELLSTQTFLPNSPTLMNAGTGNGQALAACYVLPVEDSMAGIFETLKHAAIVHKSGGGTGFSFSRLRPKGSRVGSTQGEASGPVSFMAVYDAATEHVKQGGKRRGANMGILRVDHPDILDFIDCKRTGGITNFNISVGITEAFMSALQDDKQYALKDPQTGKTLGALAAVDVWERICEAAWATGDPGLFFLDRTNASRANPVPSMGPIESTNPCGEVPLYPYDVCNLGSINLAKFLLPHAPIEAYPNPDDRIDWAGLRDTVRDAVRFLDNVIDINPYPLPEIAHVAKVNRRIGLGVMGWADLLYLLEIPYDSDQAVLLADDVMEFIADTAQAASVDLGHERGSFPNFGESIYTGLYQALRNCTVTSIAPTGTISIIAGCSSGIEPVFALAYQHTVPQPDGSTRVLDILNPIFEAHVREHCSNAEQILAYVREQGSLHGCPSFVLGDWQVKQSLVFKTAHDIKPEWHVKMQAAFQHHTDNAVSKTINLPGSATVSDISWAYRQAYDAGCLGVTVYRDGCKDWQVLNSGITVQVEAEPSQVEVIADQVARELASGLEQHFGPAPAQPSREIKPRPEVMHGYTRKIQAPEGNVSVTLNSDEAGLFEVYVNVGRAGSDLAANSEALGRLISLHLRTPSPLSQRQKAESIVRQLKHIGGSGAVGFGPKRVKSLPDAVAKAIEWHLLQEDAEAFLEYVEAGGQFELRDDRAIPEPVAVPATSQRTGDLCPECDSHTLAYQEGCTKCLSCGYSAC